MTRYASLQERLIKNSVLSDSGKFPNETNGAKRYCCIWKGLRFINGVAGYHEEYKGYGSMSIRDPRTGSPRQIKTHKVAYAIFSLRATGLAFDDSDRGHMLLLFTLLDAYKYLSERETLQHDHSCFDPRCWNPYHLKWETRDNNLKNRRYCQREGNTPLKRKLRRKVKKVMTVHNRQVAEPSQAIVNKLVHQARQEAGTQSRD